MSTPIYLSNGWNKRS